MPIPPKTAAKPPRKTATKKPIVVAQSADENEVIRETRAATALRKGKSKPQVDADTAESKLDWKTAAGIGVGSAALIAALLYANRGKK